jgi:hypothetical protein
MSTDGCKKLHSATAFKENALPEISVRMGLTYGYALVVLYETI